MLRRFSTDFAIFSMVMDLILIEVTLGLASYLRPALSNLPYVRDIPSFAVLPGFLYAAFPLIWVSSLWIFSVYDTRKNLRIWKEMTSLTMGSVVAFISIAGILYLSYRDVSRFLYISFAAGTYLLMISWRFAYRWLFNQGILKAVEPRNILVIRIDDLSTTLVQHIASYKNLGYHFIGYISNPGSLADSQYNVIGSIDQVTELIEKYQVDVLVINLPPEDQNQIISIVNNVSDLPIKIYIVPNYDHLFNYRVNLEELAGIPLLDIHAPTLGDDQRLLKRIFDLSIIVVTLPISLLTMLFVALAIRIEARGSTIFTQKRVGENGKLFDIFKFRTMFVDSENRLDKVVFIDDGGHKIYKHKDDPRVTRIGRFLRRTSLDELPQIFNILKGEMSLVGPRPEQPYLVEKYEAWQYKRFTVPPGMTGWWQIHGRSDNPLHLHVEYDIYYVENYSLFLDILILIKTFGAILSRKGAY